MARNLNQILQYPVGSSTSWGGAPAYDTTFTIDSTSSVKLDVDLWAVNNAQFLVEGAFTSSGLTSAGIGITISYGFGGTDSTAFGPVPCVLGGSSVPKFSDNVDTITTATYTLGASNQTRRTYFSLNDLRITVPRWIRLSITNNDDSYPCVIKVYIDA